jgi:hypothetical protein
VYLLCQGLSDMTNPSATRVADANGYVFSAIDPQTDDPFQVYRSCTFDGKGKGSCREEIFDGATATRFYSGAAVPLATLVNGIPNAARRAVEPVFFGRGAAIGFGISIGLWLVL